jgi:glucoamylase
MPANFHVRTAIASSADQVEKPSISSTDTNLTAIAPHLFALMLRNITSDGYVIDAPDTGRPSKPGCVIAAPSYPRDTPNVDQNYVYNWVRDAAITTFEIAAANVPDNGQILIDYVNFARLCQQNGQPTLAHACYTIDGQPRPWTEQSDGPALQTLAILAAYNQLDNPTKALANQVISTNVTFLLNEYKNPTVNLWEERSGLSFFARSTQLRCFRAIAANMFGYPVPAGITDAINWLQDALSRHWNGSYYVTLLAPPSPGNANNSAAAPDVGYDPNIDIICAAIYGAIPINDTKLLATAARLRSQWADAGSLSLYRINIDDEARGFGPLLGRYPGDLYDGDVAHPVRGGHPWALCSCNLAELYYRLATTINGGGGIPLDDLSRPFFAQIGVNNATSPADASAALQVAGDRILRGVVFHSDHLELSEQFDGNTGYEKSITNLTWSYAAFLSAVRARTGQTVQG